ncbi:MAG: tetratricopeptide repeat protein [Bacteroidales bacterium]|jgi:tetratricopeptide (TPR) repeat protein|nr:tetratricopeptide repeat protein [Bacteroidales bacterium]
MVKKSDKTRIKKAEENLEAVEGALTRSELWLEKNSKKLTIIVSAIVVIALGFFGYYRFIQQPRTERAQAEMFMAEKYFGESEYQKALDGDENYTGFLDVVDNYGNTKPGKLAAYYAGLCYLNLKEYDNAITYLKKFKGKDEFAAPMAEGAIGDAYLELGDRTNAIKQYEKAANIRNNDVTTPTFLLKAGLVYEMENKFTEAKKAYEKIRKEFPNSNESREVEKLIPRVEAKMAR